MVVTELKIVAFAGCETTLHGVGFTSDCFVNFGNNVTKRLIDVDDSSVVFVAPSEGSYSFVVENADGEESETVQMVVLNRSFMPVNKLPNRNSADFSLMLKGLLPRGFAWNFKWSNVDSEKTNWQKLLESIAGGINNVWTMLSELAVAASPAITGAVAEWNAELGLPRKGLEFDDESKTKAEIYRIARSVGGCTVPFFNKIIELFGLNAAVYEYWKDPDEFPEWVHELGEEANMYVLIKIEDSAIEETEFDCNSDCDDYLAFWWNENFENAIEFDKLAHIKFVYMYDLGE